MFGWGALLSGMVDLAGKFLTYEQVKLLRQHSDQFLALELQLQQEMQKPFDDMDDLKIQSLKTQMLAVRDAFQRDIVLVGGGAPSAPPAA